MRHDLWSLQFVAAYREPHEGSLQCEKQLRKLYEEVFTRGRRIASALQAWDVMGGIV